MKKPKKKTKQKNRIRRLEARIEYYNEMVRSGNTGGKEFTKPGSVNK